MLAVPAHAEDLMETLQLARANDPSYLAAQASYRAEAEKIPQARALLLPALSASGTTARTNTDRTIQMPGQPDVTTDADYTSNSYTLTLSQPLFNSSSFAALRQAKATVRRAEAELAAAEQTLILQVAEAYFGVLLAEENLALAKAEKAAVSRQLDLATARLEVGLATITEVHEARAQFEFTEATEIEAVNTLEDQRQALQALTGRPAGSLRELSRDPPPVTLDPPQIGQWAEAAVRDNLSVIAAEGAAEIAREEVKRQRAGHFPTLDVVGSHSRSDTGSGSIFTLPDAEVQSEDSTIELKLTVPLLQGGLVSALTEEARHRYTAAQQDLERLRREAEREARSAYLGVSSGTKKILALNQSVIAGESALQAKIEGFEAGLNTNQDVLLAQRDLFRAKRDQADARYAYIQSLLRLKLAAGRLGEKDLAEVNTWLY